MKRADPENARLALQVSQALARGDDAGARRAASALLLRAPNDANANHMLGVLALRAGDHAAARTHLERADAAAPGQAQILNTLGVALRAGGDILAARRAYARAGELGLSDGWFNLGNLELAVEDHAASVAAYERAAKLAPGDARPPAALAQAFERRHDLAAAKDHATQALKLAPGNEIARMALARVLLREGAYAEAEAAAAPATTQGTPINRAIAWGLIGEAQDRHGEPAAAFAAFDAANRLLLQQYASVRGETRSPYHPDAVRRLTAFVQEADPATWNAPPPDDASAPVFLVGFPRSGTTLLDQILSSHSGIACLEEKESLSEVVTDLVLDEGKLAALPAMSAPEIVARRAAYRERVRLAAGSAENQLLIDKLPLNIVLLPLVRRLFPDAKIIFALRDPRDVVLSCFQQRFGMNAAMVQFLDLATAAAYYDEVMTLYELSRARLGLNVHVVRYEDVVGNVEGAARGLAAFLGVAYEPGMLAFRETALKRSISTPSARQVIEPLYARSVGRWKRYAAQLAPALPTLNAWAERFGYAR